MSLEKILCITKTTRKRYHFLCILKESSKRIQNIAYSRKRVAPLARHQGIHHPLVLNISTQFLWPKKCHDIEEYVTKWHLYQANKAQRFKVASLLHHLDIPINKWKNISMDLIVGLPHTQNGHDAIWVIKDRLIKMVEFIPLKTTVKSQYLAYYKECGNA